MVPPSASFPPDSSRVAPRASLSNLFLSCECEFGSSPLSLLCHLLWRSEFCWPFWDLRPQVSTLQIFHVWHRRIWETILFCFFSFSSSFLLLLLPPSFSWLHQRWGLFIYVLLLVLELFLRGGRGLMLVSLHHGKSRNPYQLWTGKYLPWFERFLWKKYLTSTF